MKNLTKKILALMLSLSMVLSMCSVVYAEDETEDTVIVIGETEEQSETPADEDGYDPQTGEYNTVVDYNETEETAEPEDLAEETANLSDAASGTVITGTFAAKDGYDVATIRYYTDADRTAYAFADFTQDASGNYTYSFTAPYDGFTVSQAAETTIDKLSDSAAATVVASYYNLNKWDGAVDVSWYTDDAAEYHIYTPAQLAGVAAIVNGSIDSAITNVNVKGARTDMTGAKNDGLPDCIQHEHKESASLAARVTGPADVGLEKYDFANKTIYLEADMDMGGVDGNIIDTQEVMYSSSANIGNLHDGKHEGYDYYPNWMPIGGLFLKDVSDNTTAVISYFNGVFDGNGHYVNNLYCNRWSMRRQNADGSYDTSYVAYGYSDSNGFIGRIGYPYSETENITLAPAVKNMGLTGFVFGRRSVGGIVGKVSSSDYYTGNVYLENLVNKAVVYATDKFGIGGILGAGFGKGYIINCYNRGTVRQFETENSGGGIVGENAYMSVYCCYNAALITTAEAGVKRGRGIGAHDDGGSDYTIDACFYQEGLYNCDVPAYYGYYDENIPSSVSVTTTMLSASQMTNGTLLAGLNVNGTAYAAGSDGYPVLAWEAGNTEGTFTITKPQGGTITASVPAGTYRNGTIAYLSNAREDEWSFKYYTLNNNQINAPYVTIGGTTEVSGKFLKSGMGYINIPNNPVVDVKVYRVTGSADEGYKYSLLSDGDSVLENDFLSVEATLRDGVDPEDPDYEYMAAVGLDNPFTYTITYTNHDAVSSQIKSFEVSDYINETNAVLTIEVTAETTEKKWKYKADTSWYDTDDPKTSYTITTPYQLAGLDKLCESGVTFAGVTITLGNDISLANLDTTGGNRYWDGIGDAVNGFAGTFDGAGHKITDMRGCAYGLFAYCKGVSRENPCYVKNVSVYGYNYGQNASGIAGKAYFTYISGCDNYCELNGDTYTGQSYVGGIVGKDELKTIISDCTNYAPISGRYRVGGIVAESSTSTSTDAGVYTNCINLGDITCTETNSGTTACGGIAGWTSGSLVNCANYGNIASVLTYSGGLAGYSMLTFKAADSYSTGSVLYTGSKTTASAGALIGYAARFVMTNVFTYGTAGSANAAASVGAFAGTYGKNSNNRTTNVYCFGDSSTSMIKGMTISDLTALGTTDVAGINAASASDFASSAKVLAAINGNKSFVLTNGKYPEFASIASLHTHSGGTATCVSGAICDICGLAYGAADPSNHVNTGIRNASVAQWTEDGYTGDTYCKDCGTLLEQGEVIKADTEKTAVTVTFTRGDETVAEKVYSVAAFDALKSTDIIGFQYGTKFKTICATNDYVKIEDILKDNGYTYNDIVSLRVICTSSSSTLTKAMLTEDNIFYYNEGADPTTVPAVISIKNNTGQGTLEKLAAGSVYSPLRFMYGLSQEELTQMTAGGARLQSPCIGLQVELEDTVTGASVSGKISGYEGDGNVHICLKDKDGAVSAETDAAGSYKLKNISAGDYTLSVSADGYVERDYSLTVGTEAEEHSEIALDVSVYKSGDINEDGNINSADLLFLGRHVKGVGAITDPYILKLADVNGDGSVTQSDYDKLGRYVAKLDSSL